MTGEPTLPDVLIGAGELVREWAEDCFWILDSPRVLQLTESTTARILWHALESGSGSLDVLLSTEDSSSERPLVLAGLGEAESQYSGPLSLAASLVELSKPLRTADHFNRDSDRVLQVIARTTVSTEVIGNLASILFTLGGLDAASYALSGTKLLQPLRQAIIDLRSTDRFGPLLLDERFIRRQAVELIGMLTKSQPTIIPIRSHLERGTLEFDLVEAALTNRWPSVLVQLLQPDTPRPEVFRDQGTVIETLLPLPLGEFKAIEAIIDCGLLPDSIREIVTPVSKRQIDRIDGEANRTLQPLLRRYLEESSGWTVITENELATLGVSVPPAPTDNSEYQLRRLTGDTWEACLSSADQERSDVESASGLDVLTAIDSLVKNLAAQDCLTVENVGRFACRELNLASNNTHRRIFADMTFLSLSELHVRARREAMARVVRNGERDLRDLARGPIDRLLIALARPVSGVSGPWDPAAQFIRSCDALTDPTMSTDQRAMAAGSVAATIRDVRHLLPHDVLLSAAIEAIRTLNTVGETQQTENILAMWQDEATFPDSGGEIVQLRQENLSVTGQYAASRRRLFDIGLEIAALHGTTLEISTLSLQQEASRICTHCGNYDDALRYMDGVSQRLDEVLGLHHADSLEGVDGLGVALHNAGKPMKPPA